MYSKNPYVGFPWHKFPNSFGITLKAESKQSFGSRYGMPPPEIIESAASLDDATSSLKKSASSNIDPPDDFASLAASTVVVSTVVSEEVDDEKFLEAEPCPKLNCLSRR